jgi:6-phosphofructokinase
MSSKPKIGIINGGGDCPGLNTVIDSITKALFDKYSVLGFYRGFEGLYEKDYIDLTPEYTNNHKFSGGTILKSTNKGHFPGKVGDGETGQIAPEVIEQTVANFNELGLEALIVMGGDGTLSAAQQLYQNGINLVGIPKSIDNDLYGTDFTFGFHTAVDIATDALDRLETTAFSHDRVMIMEVMGRRAGWIALHAGIAGGANMILIPEMPFEVSDVKKFIQKRKNAGKQHMLMVVSEGANPRDSDPFVKTHGGNASEILFGGVGDFLARELNAEEIDTRCVTLGHIQRGGKPNSFDRIMSRQFGVYAANLIREKEYGQVVSFQHNDCCSVDIDYCVSQMKFVDPEGSMVQLSREMGVSFGESLEG